MKYSTCIVIYNEPLDVILKSLIKAGFDSVDIPGDPIKYAPNKVKPILESYSDKIKIGELTAVISPERDLINQDEKKRRIATDYIKYCIKTSAELGNNLTHFCFITNQDNLQNTPREILEERAISSIKEFANYAENLGVKLLIEPLFKDDITLINRAEQAVNLFSRALDMDPEDFVNEQKDFGLLLDIFHMHYEERDLLDALEKYHKITYHIHVADHPRGLDFNREDSIFVKRAIIKLKKLDYKGLISFETFDASYTLDKLGNSLSVLRSFENL